MDNQATQPQLSANGRPFHRGNRPGRQLAYSQAVALQDRISEMIKTNGIAPSALAALSEQWVKLENYKLSVRPRKVPAPKSHKPSTQPTADSHFIEDDSGSTTEPTTDDSPPTT